MALVYLGVGSAMLLCSAAGLLFDLIGYHRPGVDDGGTLALLGSGLLALALGGALVWWGRQATGDSFGRREAPLAVSAIWGGVSLLGALPFVFGAGIGPVDAVFEAASGFTTTGATIVADIEGTLSRPLLLWRSLMQWLGGMGIVVLFVAIFPNLGVAGKHMFRSEVPGVTAEGLQPRIRETSSVLWRLYVGFTALEVVALKVLGMSWFESVCHSFTTMSTGGFSTRNASIGAYDSPAIELVITGFMIIAGVNFGLYFGAIRSRRLGTLYRSPEFRVYLALIAACTTALSVLILGNHGDLFASARAAIFMVATTVTSTGFGTDDYMAYPPAGLAVVLLLMWIGGCAGSTAGGMKVSRIILLIETARTMIRRTLRPAVVQVVRLEGRVVHDAVLLEVSTFFFLFMVCMAGGCMAVALTDGVSLPTAFGAMLTSLSNMGPAPFYEGTDNFASYSAFAKLLFCVAMIMGRLEFFTVIALLLPDVWRT